MTSEDAAFLSIQAEESRFWKESVKTVEDLPQEDTRVDNIARWVEDKNQPYITKNGKWVIPNGTRKTGEDGNTYMYWDGAWLLYAAPNPSHYILILEQRISDLEQQVKELEWKIKGINT